MKYDANRLGNGKKTMTANQIKQYVDENAGGAYTAGSGIDITGNEISVDNTIATKSEVQAKQDILTAGSGIDITGNEISVDNTIATKSEVQAKQDILTAGTGITIAENVISASASSEAVQVPFTEWGNLVESVDSDYFKFKSDVIIATFVNTTRGTLLSSIYYPKNVNLLKASFSLPAYNDIQSNSFTIFEWYTNYNAFINGNNNLMAYTYYRQIFTKGNEENTFTLTYGTGNANTSKTTFKIVKLN